MYIIIFLILFSRFIIPPTNKVLGGILESAGVRSVGRSVEVQSIRQGSHSLEVFENDLCLEKCLN